MEKDQQKTGKEVEKDQQQKTGKEVGIASNKKEKQEGK